MQGVCGRVLCVGTACSSCAVVWWCVWCQCVSAVIVSGIAFTHFTPFASVSCMPARKVAGVFQRLTLLPCFDTLPALRVASPCCVTACTTLQGHSCGLVCTKPQLNVCVWCCRLSLVTMAVGVGAASLPCVLTALRAPFSKTGPAAFGPPPPRPCDAALSKQRGDHSGESLWLASVVNALERLARGRCPCAVLHCTALRVRAPDTAAVCLPQVSCGAPPRRLARVVGVGGAFPSRACCRDELLAADCATLMAFSLARSRFDALDHASWGQALRHDVTYALFCRTGVGAKAITPRGGQHAARSSWHPLCITQRCLAARDLAPCQCYAPAGATHLLGSTKQPCLSRART
jgi:hypothetical protein